MTEARDHEVHDVTRIDLDDGRQRVMIRRIARLRRIEPGAKCHGHDGSITTHASDRYR